MPSALTYFKVYDFPPDGDSVYQLTRMDQRLDWRWTFLSCADQAGLPDELKVKLHDVRKDLGYGRKLFEAQLFALDVGVFVNLSVKYDSAICTRHGAIIFVSSPTLATAIKLGATLDTLLHNS